MPSQSHAREEELRFWPDRVGALGLKRVFHFGSRSSVGARSRPAAERSPGQRGRAQRGVASARLNGDRAEVTGHGGLMADRFWRLADKHAFGLRLHSASQVVLCALRSAGRVLRYAAQLKAGFGVWSAVGSSQGSLFGSFVSPFPPLGAPGSSGYGLLRINGDDSTTNLDRNRTLCRTGLSHK